MAASEPPSSAAGLPPDAGGGAVAWDDPRALCNRVTEALRTVFRSLEQHQMRLQHSGGGPRATELVPRPPDHPASSVAALPIALQTQLIATIRLAAEHLQATMGQAQLIDSLRRDPHFRAALEESEQLLQLTVQALTGVCPDMVHELAGFASMSSTIGGRSGSSLA